MSESNPWLKMSKAPDGDAVMEELLAAYAKAYPHELNAAANAANPPRTQMSVIPALQYGGMTKDGAYIGGYENPDPAFQAHKDLDALRFNPPVKK